MIHLFNVKKSRHVDFLNALPHDAIVAELGVHRGDYALTIYNSTTPKLLYLVDLWADDILIANGDDIITGQEAMNCVKFRFKDIESVKLIKQDISELYNYFSYYFDWVYLDAFHTYDDTLKQLYICDAIVKKDGFICGHDYDLSSFNYGVANAIDTFCSKTSWCINTITVCDDCNSFILSNHRT